MIRDSVKTAIKSRMGPDGKLVYIGFLLILSSYCNAANRFWISGVAANWNSTANWATASGGLGGASVPVAGDAVFFDNGGLGDCIINTPVTVTSINVNATYTGTISQGANTIIASGASTFSGGTFSGGAADIIFGGAFTLSGTNFTSTSTTTEFRHNTAFSSGSFNHNNGSVKYNCTAVGAQTISGTSPSFNNLELVGLGKTYTITSAGNITVLGNLAISGALFININTGAVDVNGDITITNTATGCGGSATINIIGTGTQNFTGSPAAGQGALPKLNINKTSGVLNLFNFPGVANNFTYTGGTINAGSSTFCFTRGSVGTYSITGSTTFNNICYWVNASGVITNLAAGTILTANGDLSLAGAGNITINTGDINLNGNMYLTNTATGGGGSATINVIGNSSQLIDGTGVSTNQSRLPLVNINKSSGILSLSGIISFASNVSYTAGTIDPTTSTFTIVRSLTISGSFTVYNLTVESTANVTVTVASGSTITANNDLNLGSGANNLSINTGTIAAQGNINITNTGTNGGGNGTLLINGSGNQTISGSGIINQGRLPAVTINKSSGTLVFPSLLTVSGNWTYSSGILDPTTNNSTIVFANSLTITGSHTLNNINFNGAGNYTIATAAGTTLTITGSMEISGPNNITLNNGNIDLLGALNLTNTAVGGGGTTVISFKGNTNQAITSTLLINQSRLPAITVNKPSGILSFPALITIRGNWTYVAGTMDHVTNNATVVFNNSLTISGSHALNNITLEGSASYTFTISTGTILTVTGTLSVIGGSNVTISTPVSGATAIEAQGDISISNTGAGGGGTATILINGSGAQSFSSSATVGRGRMPFLKIQKASGTLTLSGTISESRDWTYNSGTVNASTSSVAFGGNNLAILSSGMNFYNVLVTANTSTLSSNLTVANDLTVTGGVLAPGSNTINLSGNWSDYGTAGFTESTSTVNFAGTALQTITVPGGENFSNMVLNNSAPGTQLLNDVTIASTFTMTQGNLDLNGNNLNLGTSVANKGTLAYTTGTIIGTGTFKRWFNTTTIADGSVNGLFPVGTATNYRPFYVSAPITGPTTGGSITLAYNNATTTSSVSFPDGAFTVLSRKDLFWNLATANGLAGGNYNLRAEGTGFGTIGNVADLRLTLVNSVTGTAGTNGGTTSNPQINRTGISVANLTNSFYVGSIVTELLPITLISFTAINENEIVRLDWETASEFNNNYFTIQRSTNAIDWENVKVVKGAGSTSSARFYSATDESPYEGVSYYRLQQTDIDGKTTYSAVRVVSMKSSGSFSLYPNPATDHILVSYAHNGKLQIGIYNSSGQKMNLPMIENGTSVTINISGMSPGIYFVKVAANGVVETRKIIKN